MSRHTPQAHVSKTRAFPTLKSEMLSLIEEICPEPIVTPGQSEAEIMFQAGRRSVLRDLRIRFEDSFARPGDPA